MPANGVNVIGITLSPLGTKVGVGLDLVWRGVSNLEKEVAYYNVFATGPGDEGDEFY